MINEQKIAIQNFKTILHPAPPTFWNQSVDKMTKKKKNKNNSKWVQQASLLVMIYKHNRNLVARPIKNQFLCLLYSFLLHQN